MISEFYETLVIYLTCYSETDCKRGEIGHIKLPFGEVRLISKNCSATVGQVGNAGVNQKSLGRAGSKCWLGKRSVVRGVVMYPVNHPVVKGGPQLVEKKLFFVVLVNKREKKLFRLLCSPT